MGTCHESSLVDEHETVLMACAVGQWINKLPIFPSEFEVWNGADQSPNADPKEKSRIFLENTT